ncbi:hypothetical protein LTR56_011511 [Elasticomyces elasticus]|nr:hypothetical protein LTR22_020387 [Elasticomyces elasticus]KAK3641065.1 hypothetical protein LTR56_011511 [Elasticomyces elasticus]KAK4930231.1 hypothetical protein LTR49_003265 [Elasticomyces elasticus]KAK5761394.1 hypothetical protein LTS12_008498 [Elasticomyces elasticus]
MTPFAARLILSSLVALFCLFGTARAATAAQWRQRSIFQVVTDRFVYRDGSDDILPPLCAVENGLYCGGTWQGIKSKLDYIQGMNFDAIWISPVVAQLPQSTGDGEAYTGYWQQDLYSLNPKFGTAKDLKDLIDEVHARGMYLMLDIVVNHMGYAGTGWDVDYSVLSPFNDQKYFHQYCPVNDPHNITNTEECWLGDSLVTLADLRTEDEDVQAMFGDWISEMVSNYSIDGLRIDTALNVQSSFFPNFVDEAGVFAMGETMHGDNSYACQWADAMGSILNYPIYYTLTRAFQSCEGSIGDLVATINSAKTNCRDTTVLGSFSENHDVPRFANYTDDLSLAKNIIAFNFADGIPIIYQGQEQHMNGDVSPYMNRAPLWETGFNTDAPLYQHIATLNAFRQHIIKHSKNYTQYMNEVVYENLHSLAMRKGFDGSQVITVLNNNGVTAEYFLLEITGHGFAPGTKLTEVLTCASITINETGYLNVPMFAGTPKVLYPTKLLRESSFCGMNDASEPLPSSTTITQTSTMIINGHPTVVSTAKVIPIPAATTPGDPDSTPDAPHPHPPKGSHRALGGAETVERSIPMMISAAVAAGVASAGYLAGADLLDSGHA